MSETCCAVIEVTRLSNGSGASGGRNPARRGDDLAEHRLRRGPGRERRRARTRAPSSFSTTGRVASSSGSTSTPPRRRRDPHLAPADDAVQRAVVPEVREVGAEHAEALGRELEVVRLRKAQQQRRRGSRTARTGAAVALEVGREPAAGEDAVGGKRGAAVGDAVADVDERPARPGSERRLHMSPQTGQRPVVPEAQRASRPRAGRRRCSEPRARGPRARAPGAISCGRPLETITGRKPLGERGGARPDADVLDRPRRDLLGGVARIVPTSAASDSP